jgi:hypothetical protein
MTSSWSDNILKLSDGFGVVVRVAVCDRSRWLEVLFEGWHLRWAIAIWVEIGSFEVDGEVGSDICEGVCGLVMRNLVVNGRRGGGGTNQTVQQEHIR